MIEDPRTTVHALLAAARIAPPEAEVEQMIAGYPALRSAADSLYLDEVAPFAPAFLPSDGDRDEVPAASGASHAAPSARGGPR